MKAVAASLVFLAGALHGHRAVHDPTRDLHRIDPPRGRSSADSNVRLARAWPVMGTMLTITVSGRDTSVLRVAMLAARDSVRVIDSLMSSYRPESDISRVNRGAGGDAEPVSLHTIRVLQQARVYWRLSDGAFDPTVGPLMQAWGFQGTRGRIPGRRVLDSLRTLVGFGRVEVDSGLRRVRLPVRGMQLDLGGIAKGYALDLARAALARPEVESGSIDLGGNVLVFGVPPNGQGWSVSVVHPRDPTRSLALFSLDSGAVATSGDYEHFYRINGRRYAHLIDPRTGMPAHGVVSLTVVAPRGVWSDGLSAALYLLGPDRGVRIADSLPGIAAVWVLDPGRANLRRRDIVRSARARTMVRVSPSIAP